MHSPFDILKKKPDGSFRWFEAVNDLASANIRIKWSLPSGVDPETCWAGKNDVMRALVKHNVLARR